MINATLINATNASANLTGFEYLKQDLAPTVLERFVDLVKAPWNNTEMLWIVLPLIIIIFALEFYFGRYTEEEIGWNTAVANNLVLVFVSMDLLRYMHRAGTLNILEGSFPPELLVALLIFFEGIALFFADFFHFLPKKVAFLISSELPVNLTAYVGIAVVYSDIPFDLITLLAALVLFFILLAFFHLVRLIEPHAYESKKS